MRTRLQISQATYMSSNSPLFQFYARPTRAAPLLSTSSRGWHGAQRGVVALLGPHDCASVRCCARLRRRFLGRHTPRSKFLALQLPKPFRTRGSPDWWGAMACHWYVLVQQRAVIGPFDATGPAGLAGTCEVGLL